VSNEQIDISTLPDLETPYAISDEQRQQYQQDGHLLLRGVASPDEAAAYRPVISNATFKYNKETRPVSERETRYAAFLQVSNLWEHDEGVKKFVVAKRFAKIAADLMGVDGVRVYHDQALYKEPGGSITPWHQDQYYWPLDTDNTITMWMPLVDVPIEMGALTFASGSHKEGCYEVMAISDESELTYKELVAQRGWPVVNAAMKAGDATFHSGWTLHNAPANSTDQMREVMTIIYFADGARVIEPDNDHRPKDLERWMPGLKPGDLAASELNPLVFKR
jgi:ectoine hydroxylase-related dioxygenase (phytanoyl-CoA dioxygenase family)